MNIEHTSKGTTEILVLSGDLDSISSIYFKECMSKVYTTGNYNTVIDLNDVDFVDSAGLGQMVSALKMCVHHGGNLVIVGAGDTICDLLRITKLDTILRIYQDLDEAVSSFHS